MNLLDCAKIATSSMMLRNREDFMQDAIEHILRKNIQYRETAYIIRSMKNKIIDIIRENRRLRRAGCYEHTVTHDVASTAEYDYFDFFSHVKPRFLMVAMLLVNDGFDETRTTTGLSTKRLQNIFYHVKKQVRGC